MDNIFKYQTLASPNGLGIPLPSTDDWLKKQRKPKGLSLGFDKDQWLAEHPLPSFNNPPSEPKKKNIFEKFGDTKFGQTLTKANAALDSKIGNTGLTVDSAINTGLNVIGGMIGNRSEYEGAKGNVTKGMDKAYDTIADAMAAVPGWGQAASMAMKGLSVLNKGIGKLGGGTDGMTTGDAILGSSFLGWTPIGLINGFGGQKADTYTRNTELDTASGSGFSGFQGILDLTLIGAGKKYGLFSSGARHKQNELNRFTLGLKNTISNVVEENTLNLMSAAASTPFINSALTNTLNGGVGLIQAAQKGMKLKKPTFMKFKRPLYTLPTNVQWLNVSDKQRSIAATGNQSLIPATLTALLKQGIAPIPTNDGRIVYMQSDGSISNTSMYEQQPLMAKNGRKMAKRIAKKEKYTSNQPKNKERSLEELKAFALEKNPEFILRLENDPTVVPFIDSRSPEEIKYGTHYLANDGNRVYPTIVPDGEGSYVYLDNIDVAYDIADLTGNYLEFNTPKEALMFAEHYKEMWSEYISKFEAKLKTMLEQAKNIESFKLGGTMNVIPEGALHARKHHLTDIDEKFKEVTHKGIPVITEEEGGEIVQHAEIEHSEIIFNKEVTDKIEELRDKYNKEKNDAYAIEAGKIITEEILYHTDDRMNLIKSIE